MDFSKLISKAKDLAGNENVKSAVKKVASNKKVKDAVTKATKSASKVAKTLGVDLTTIVTFAMKNKSVIDALSKLGLKSESDPASSAVQKLVSSLKNTISKAAGTKIEDKTFSSIVTKLLSNSTVKSKVEDAAGKGVSSFIKKAVAEYIS